MSLLIKGMEMPKDEEMLCINIYPDGKVCINLDLECKQIATAVPVPPHGDLIERDAIKFDWDEDNQTWGYDIYSAPTIIPAEEGET